MLRTLGIGLVVAGLYAALIVSCSGPEPITRGTANTGSGSPGSGPGVGGASNPTGGSAGTTMVNLDGGPVPTTDGGCQMHEIIFERQIPTVYVLVDRSWTMFDQSGQPPMDAWTPLRDGVLQVLSELQAEVRFGFAAFTGHQGGVCPVIDSVPQDLNNHANIAAIYNSLAKTTDKGETPTTMALAMARDALLADTTPGGKYVLFVTDGEPDYCNDNSPICPVDSVTSAIQIMTTQGIGTFVFGITTTAAQVPPGGLQAWANAGRGLPAALFLRNQNMEAFTPTQLYDECIPVAGWAADAAALGGRDRITNPTLATYSAVGGDAPVYQPNLAAQGELANQLRSVIAGVKSCTFDLQGEIEVILERAGEGHVYVQDVEVPYDATGTNGWRMATPTAVELVGQACVDWQTPEKTKINFDFPCDIIIVVF